MRDQGSGTDNGVTPTSLGDAARDHYELGELLAIARALASERDIRTLLDLILAKSRQITGADAGSVYVVEDIATVASEDDPWAEVDAGRKQLRFMLSQNDSMKVDFKEFVLPVDERSIVGKAVLDRTKINIEDLQALQRDDTQSRIRHNRTFDERTGYQARSMLTVPLLSARGEPLGVIQLINKKRDPNAMLTTPADVAAHVVPFDPRSEELALALAAQAGLSLENAVLYEEIRRLFEGFVDASVTAIESRDPTTSGHSRRVATLSVALAERVDAVKDGPLANISFSRDDLRQIEFAGVLHDFGKVGVRENVLVKAKKLYPPQLDSIRQRLDYARKCLEVEFLAEQLHMIERGGGNADALTQLARKHAHDEARIERLWTLVMAANEPTIMDGERLDELTDLAMLKFKDAHGRMQNYLCDEEVAALQVARGSLTEAERREIQSHVNHTISFLKTIPWGRAFARIPHIAGAHHESLDGGGYPYGLKGEEIPVEARMLTISDIFDALTASDRPYKAAVPVTRALSILEDEVRRGRCDPLLFNVFIETKIYEKVL
ncbi:MAG: HD domain-containing phosphohydrolase [Deltaproteobacteria bacterium]|nr:HD domain-containing phosphohydrolase [Deltaproteobacteria bacterium]